MAKTTPIAVFEELAMDRQNLRSQSAVKKKNQERLLQAAVERKLPGDFFAKHLLVSRLPAGR